MPPDQFIKVAEQAGLIIKLTQVIIEKAVDAAETWPSDIHLGINLSTVDLCSPEATVQLLHLVKRRQFDPQRITVEITETAAMQDFEKAVQSLNWLRQAGVSIALDDFGAGNSSLGYLQKLPLDHVKMDKSFTKDVAHDNRACEVVSTITKLCSNLDLTCVAEGVETEHQFEKLRNLGCRYLQGYYFAKPMSNREASQYISQHTVSDAMNF